MGSQDDMCKPNNAYETVKNLGQNVLWVLGVIRAVKQVSNERPQGGVRV